MLKLTIPPTDKDYAIIRNINDTLLWYRVSDAVWKIINAARMEERDFEADTYYHGLSVSFFLLGVNHDDKLSGALDKIFWQHKESSDEKKQDGENLWSMQVASEIYSEWLIYLKELTLTNLKPVA